MKHSTGNRTKAEQLRFDRIKEMGVCMACYQDGNHLSADGEVIQKHIEINHMLSGNRRIGHMATFSLCVWHHQAEPHDWHTKAHMAEKYGPSLKYPGSKIFRARYGTDKELLAMQNALLDERYGN